MWLHFYSSNMWILPATLSNPLPVNLNTWLYITTCHSVPHFELIKSKVQINGDIHFLPHEGSHVATTCSAFLITSWSWFLGTQVHSVLHLLEPPSKSSHSHNTLQQVVWTAAPSTATCLRTKTGHSFKPFTAAYSSIHSQAGGV
jgi:hypothetical protein